MKMRRTLAAMMSGILAMSPAGVIFADEAAQTPVTYGDMISLSLTQDGETLSADITAVYNESGDSSFSVSVTLPASMMGTEEPVVYGFDDVLRVCGEDVYLNVEEIVNIYSELTADDSMTELLSMVGITESWLEIPAPTASDDGQLDTILTAITDNLADLETVETDTGVQIAINNDTLLTIAQSIDEAMASVEGTDGESAEEDIEGLEFVSDYILAAAEGFREADPELSEEDSVALVSELVDALLAGVEEEFSMGSDESSDISFAELLSSALEYAAFEGTLSIDSADGVSAVLLDLSATAEGEDAIGVQLGIASITDGEFAEFTSPESFASLRDVVKNVASLYYTSSASYEEPSEEISTELADELRWFPIFDTHPGG